MIDAWALPARELVPVAQALFVRVGGRSLDNPYTVFVVSALIIILWLAAFALMMSGRREE